MTLGTGIAILGVWSPSVAAIFSKRISGGGMILFLTVSIIMTIGILGVVS